MDGEILKGPSRGKYLSGLTDEELADLHRLCSTAGDQSQTLLEAWLDRAKPEWREQFGTGSRSGSAGAGGKMSVNDAYAALGLKPGATAQDVKAAHRRLMKQVHPDHGGSDFLAAKINEAKDTLLAAL
jgi:DnaJ-domain-containing protein 1